MRVPVPLQNGDLLAVIEALHEELSQPGRRGGYKIAVNYGPDGDVKATIEAPSQTFVVREGRRPRPVLVEKFESRLTR